MQPSTPSPRRRRARNRAPGASLSLALFVAPGGTLEGMPLLPEPKPATTVSKDPLPMCKTESCPRPLPQKKMKLTGSAVVLAADIRGPKHLVGISTDSGDKPVRRETKLPTLYADMAAGKPDGAKKPLEGTRLTGFGHYCSVTWTSGHWAMAWSTGEHSDPCGWLASLQGGGKINRAGVFSRDGMNTAIVRCNGGAGAAYRGYGTGPLSHAFEAATKFGPGSCKMTVGPANVPLFSSEVIRGGASRHGTGFDFARDGYTTVPADYGQSGSSAVAMLNQLGKRKGDAIDNHDGHDYDGTETDIALAVGPGRVFAQRFFDTTANNDDSTGRNQGETYIRHDLIRTPAQYSESWISAYFHMDKVIYRVGEYVDAGDAIGEVGSRGWSNVPHVHLDVMKITNPVWGDDRVYDFELLPGPGGAAHNGGPVKVEPAGFNAPSNIDPWAWKAAAPNGALSSDLWVAGTEPPHGAWGQ